MSQPVSFRVEGVCNEGDHIVVDQWPDLRCDPPVRPEVIYKTTQVTKYVEQPVKEVVTVPPAEASTSWWWYALAAFSVGLIAWAIRRRSNRRRRTDVYHHKDR